MGREVNAGMITSALDGLFLHASAVVVDGGALLFLGHSSAGKSTIASLLDKTYATLADDVVFASSDCHGNWRVMDGRCRYEEACAQCWEDAARLRLADGPGIPLLGCARIHKARHVKGARLAPVETARYLMNAVNEVPMQNTFGKLKGRTRDKKNIVSHARRMRRQWLHQAAEIARVYPGWRLWFSRDSHFSDLFDTIAALTAQPAGK